MSTFSIRASDGSHTPRRGVHRHSHYEILLIEQGTGTHMVDFNIYAVKSNQVYFLRPGQVHEFSPDASASFYFIAFDKAEMMLHAQTAFRTFDFFQSFACKGPVLFDEVVSIVSHLKDIQYELQQAGYLQSALVSSLVTVLLIKMQRKFKDCGGHTDYVTDPLVQAFNQLLDDPSVGFRFVQDYAKALHVSATYLNDKVRQSTGHPASYWIHQSVVLYAKQLLHNVEVPLKRIATQLGFSNPTHFSRFFKAHAAVTPSQYRHQVGVLVG